MIGILGGTFDPVHFGHLRPALEVLEALNLRELRLLPAGQPPHRPPPQATARQRETLLRAALGQDTPGLVVDDREIRRPGPSYMVDTLASLRAELGDEPLCLVLGMDAFLQLHTWQRWQEIPALAHLAVTHRPGWQPAPTAEDLVPELARLWRRTLVSEVAALKSRPAGHILLTPVTPLDISATQIRALIGAGRSPRFLVPDPVWNLIRLQGLYHVLPNEKPA